VRVVVTHRLGDRTGRLGVAAVRTEPGVVHRVEHAAVHRLETVAHLRQRAPDDHAHGIVDVAVLHLLLNVDRFGPVPGGTVGWQGGVSHLILYPGVRRLSS
jgi:hypothetical protein